MINFIDRKQTGLRRVVGALLPVENQLQRQQTGARVEWVIARGVCNGTADEATGYPTRREAMAAWAACDTCGGRGMIFTMISGYDWYEGGGFPTEAVEESYCNCKAGDERRAEVDAHMARWRADRDAEAARLGADAIPF